MITTYQLSLGRWFPPNDPIATSVAKLCILREDYFLELHGMVIGGIAIYDDSRPLQGLDENSSGWRRIYFFRNTLRTLTEILGVVRRLYSDDVYRDALANEAKPLQDAFADLNEAMIAIPEIIKELRDKIGGHILHSSVQDALDKLTLDSTGYYQQGEIRGTSHYRFSSELVLSMMLPGIPGNEVFPKLDELLSSAAQFVRALGPIDGVIAAYHRTRRLPFL